MAKQILLLILQLLSGYCACCSCVCIACLVFMGRPQCELVCQDMKSLFFKYCTEGRQRRQPYCSRHLFPFASGHIIGGSCDSYRFRRDESFVATGMLLSREKMCFVTSNACLLRQNFRHDKNDICGRSRQWCGPAPLPPSMTAAGNSRRIAGQNCSAAEAAVLVIHEIMTLRFSSPTF